MGVETVCWVDPERRYLMMCRCSLQGCQQHHESFLWMFKLKRLCNVHINTVYYLLHGLNSFQTVMLPYSDTPDQFWKFLTGDFVEFVMANAVSISVWIESTVLWSIDRNTCILSKIKYVIVRLRWMLIVSYWRAALTITCSWCHRWLRYSKSCALYCSVRFLIWCKFIPHLRIA